LGELKWSLADLAREIQESPQTINNWKKRGRIAGAKRATVAAKVGRTSDWLATGKEDQRYVGISEPLIRAYHPDDAPRADDVMIAEESVRFSGGHGSYNIEYAPMEDREPATFRLAYFQRERMNPKRVKRFRVTGRSMEPLLFPGDAILVNLEETSVREGLVYVFRHGDELKVKKLIPRADGSLVLRSINREEFPDDVIPADRVVEEVTIIGRVRDKSGRGGL
jgi:phage repressor protein C with HTH and peptisase S24 domain